MLKKGVASRDAELAKLRRVAEAAKELFDSECASVCGDDKVERCDFGRDLKDALTEAGYE